MKTSEGRFCRCCCDLNRQEKPRQLKLHQGLPSLPSETLAEEKPPSEVPQTLLRLVRISIAGLPSFPHLL
jgi:hypothetical protein